MYTKKYLKYKNKYFKLKKQIGGLNIGDLIEINSKKFTILKKYDPKINDESKHIFYKYNSNLKIYEETSDIEKKDIYLAKLSKDLPLYINNNSINIQSRSKTNNLNKDDIEELKKESNSLVYIGGGCLGSIYFDTNLKKIVKFSKKTFSEESEIEDGTFRITKNWLTGKITKKERKNLLKATSNTTVSNYLEKFKKIRHINNELRNMTEIHNVIKDLPSFLQIDGFIIYRKLLHINSKGGENYPAISAIYEYYPDLIDELPFIQKENKTQFLQIVKDLQKLNSRKYIHSDLQEQCRNIATVNDGTKFIIIDIDSIKSMLNMTNINIYDLLKMKPNTNSPFKDFFSLLYCFNVINILTEEDILNFKVTIKEKTIKLLKQKRNYIINNMNESAEVSEYIFDNFNKKDLFININNIINEILNILNESYDSLINKLK